MIDWGLLAIVVLNLAACGATVLAFFRVSDRSGQLDAARASILAADEHLRAARQQTEAAAVAAREATRKVADHASRVEKVEEKHTSLFARVSGMQRMIKDLRTEEPEGEMVPEFWPPTTPPTTPQNIGQPNGLPKNFGKQVQ